METILPRRTLLDVVEGAGRLGVIVGRTPGRRLRHCELQGVWRRARMTRGVDGRSATVPTSRGGAALPGSQVDLDAGSRHAHSPACRDREPAAFPVRRDPGGLGLYIYMCGANPREPNGRDRPCSAGADREVAPAPRGPLVTEAVSRRLREFVWMRCNPATAARHRPETGRHMLPGFDYTPFAAIGREHGPASGTGRAAVRSPRTWRYSPLSRTIGDAADRGPMPARGSLCRFPRTYRARRNGIPTLRSEGPGGGLP